MANEAPATQNLQELTSNVRLLARYSVETGQLPASVDIEQLYTIQNRIWSGEELDQKDFGALVRSYQTLERRLGPVTVDTLKATERATSPDGTVTPSEAEQYVSWLWKRTVWSIALVLAFHLLHAVVIHVAPETLGSLLSTRIDQEPSAHTVIDQEPSAPTVPENYLQMSIALLGVITTYLIPFLYGALGADAFLLRETTHKLHLRQFDPRRIPENRARFLLGSLTGGVIALFVSDKLVSETLPDAIFAVAGAAPGFLAGYSSDFLFQTLKRIIGAILPSHRGLREPSTEDRRAQDELLQRYRRMMDNAQDPDMKNFLKTVVEDLESRARSGSW